MINTDNMPNFALGYDTIVGTVVVAGDAGEDFGDVNMTLEEWEEKLRKWR